MTRPTRPAQKQSRSRGFGLVELLMTIGLTAVMILGVAALRVRNLNMQTRNSSLLHMSEFRQNVLGLVFDTTAWTNTVTAADNQASPAFMGCLLLGTPCTEDGTVGGVPLADKPFALFTRESTTVPFYDATNPAAGLTQFGQACAAFSTSPGSDACPYRFELTWSAICEVGSCINPQVRVKAQLLYRPATEGVFASINTAIYSIEQIYPRAVAPTAACVPGGACSLSVGQYASCATVDGVAKCWGYNNNRQLGDGTGAPSRSSPVDVDFPTGSTVKQIALSWYLGCGIVDPGAVYCWSRNNGRFGNGGTANSNTPLAIGPLATNVAEISVGLSSACAIQSSALYCWGEINTNGQLGNGTTTTSTSPVAVSGMNTGVTSFSVGSNFACAVRNGGAYCWGQNSVGQLGNNAAGTDSSTPVQVSGLATGVRSVSAGYSHACAVLDTGTVQCWGVNTVGQLGNGTTVNSAVPVTVSGIASGATLVTAGTSHSCAIVSGAVKCWGSNASGALGNNSTTNSSTPVDVAGLTSVTILATGLYDGAEGAHHTCAIRSDRTFSCWGENSRGQLGNGSNTDSWIPVTPAAL